MLVCYGRRMCEDAFGCPNSNNTYQPKPGSESGTITCLSASPVYGVQSIPDESEIIMSPKSRAD